MKAKRLGVVEDPDVRGRLHRDAQEALYTRAHRPRSWRRSSCARYQEMLNGSPSSSEALP